MYEDLLGPRPDKNKKTDEEELMEELESMPDPKAIEVEDEEDPWDDVEDDLDEDLDIEELEDCDGDCDNCIGEDDCKDEANDPGCLDKGYNSVR